MKLVFNTDQIHLHGGIEKVMATKANHFISLPNTEVYIVTTEQRGMGPCYDLDKRIHLIDLGVNYNRTKSYFSWENLRKAYMHFTKQKRLFKSLKPDVILSPNFNFDHFWLPFIKGQAQLIKERHSSRYFEENDRQQTNVLKNRIEDWINSKYDQIIVLNESEKSYVYSNNAIVIPNPVDDLGYTANLDNKMVIAAGRISPVKGYDHLIKAWKIVYENAPDWQLHIYGEDYLETQKVLQELVVANGLENVVYFKGLVKDLPQTMTDYSLYAMTSVSECFPMVLLEAMTVGLPIVTYDVPTGPRHIVTDGEEGFITPYQDPNVWADKVLILMKDSLLRKKMGKQAKVNVNRFKTGVVMKKWETLLNWPNV